MRGVLLIKTVVYFFDLTLAVQEQCDMETDILLEDGGMGMSSDFNWLGLLKVFLDDIDEVHVAVTGIVLVKPRYALASADDVVRIPLKIFQKNTHAMFVAEGDVQVTYSPVTYIVHPEYRAQTFNSIVLIELKIVDDSPLIPICSTAVSFDTRHLYLTGFTDENKVLEKMFYRIQYTDRQECEKFYKQPGLTDMSRHRQPISYLCGKWQADGKSCVWDNGMALVTNSSRWFSLVGFSIHGPGCAAPARFINILLYNSWINNVTYDENEEVYDYITSDLDLDQEYIPIHRTFTESQSKWNSRYNGPKHHYGPDGLYWPYWWWKPVYEATIKHEFIKWPFPVDTLQHFYIVANGNDPDVVVIKPFNNMYALHDNAAHCTEDENNKRHLKYEEEFQVKETKNFRGTVMYKFSTYDLNLHGLTCVTLSVKCKNRSRVNLWFREEPFASFLHDAEDITPRAPKEVMINLKTNTINITRSKRDKNTIKNSAIDDNIDRDRKYRPERSKLTGLNKKILTYRLFIKINFVTNAALKFKMYTNDKFSAKTRKTVNSHPIRRAFNKKKLPKRKKMHWKFAKEVVDKTIRQPDLVVDHNVVLETASKGDGGKADPETIVIICLLMSIWARKYLLIFK